jgi:hypothetical protein
MSDDIFADWKTEKFIVAESYLTSDLTDKILVVMTDFKYWTEYADECLAWCKQYGCEVKGMTIEIPDEETLLLFRLKWS